MRQPSIRRALLLLTIGIGLLCAPRDATAQVPPPTVTTLFGAASIPLNGSSALTFSIFSPSSFLTGVGFTDTLPAGLRIATPNGLSASCAGTITATAGSNVISLSGAIIPLGATCLFGLVVQGIGAGALTNSTGPVTTNEAGTVAAASATIHVEAAPGIQAAFNPSTILLNQTTSLIFFVINPSANADPLMGVAFTDTLPAALTVANSSALVCGGVLTTTAPSGIAFSTTTLATNTYCQLSVPVTGRALGDYQILTSNVTSTNGGIGGASRHEIFVAAAPPTTTMVFGTQAILLNATTSLTFTFVNPPINAVTLTGLQFSDALPTGLVVATPNGASNTCGGTLTAAAGSSSISLAGGTLAPNATCTIVVTIKGTVVGVWDNFVSQVFSNEGGFGLVGVIARITVAGPPNIQKRFFQQTIPVGGSALLSFTVQNPNPTLTLAGVAFTDTFPPGLEITDPFPVNGTCGAGTITVGNVSGSGVVSLSGGTITTGGSCTFTVIVHAATPGIKNNVTSNVTSSNAGTGNTATATVTVPCTTSLTIQPATLPPAIFGQPYTQPLTAAGATGTPTFSLQSGTLPTGVSFNSAGFTGSPTNAGAFHFTVLAQIGASCQGTRSYDLDVNHEPFVAVGPGFNGVPPQIRTFVPALGAATLDAGFNAYSPGFGGGVRVAVGDVNGDGVPDLVTVPGPGGGPDVRIFDGASHALIGEFFAMPASYTGGLSVAVGDVNGDGAAEIIVGPDQGAPLVKVFNSAGVLLWSFFAYSPSFAGGVRVAAGDVNGDGYADVVTGPGPGGGPHVLAFSGYDGSVLASFFAYAPTFTGGVYVATGDVDGDGMADIITGADAGGGPHVRVFSGATGAVLRSFFAYAPAFTGGVRVAALDVNHDGQADIVTAPGPGGGPHVRVWDGATGAELLGLFAYDPSFTDGVYLGAAISMHRMSIDVPGPGASVASPFAIAGWALQEGAPSGTGVDAIHIYAFPAAGGSPIFLGVGVLGDARPDVAAFFGGRYRTAGYHLNVSSLPPGDYFVVVYVHSAQSHTFNDRRVVRMTVR